MGDDWASPDAIGVSLSKRAGSPTSAARCDAPAYPCTDRHVRMFESLDRGGVTQSRRGRNEDVLQLFLRIAEWLCRCHMDISCPTCGDALVIVSE
jgi:hypothetical protein